MGKTPPDFVNEQALKYGKRCIGTTKGVERKETPQASDSGGCKASGENLVTEGIRAYMLWAGGLCQL